MSQDSPTSKRDLDLFRLILLEMESWPLAQRGIPSIEIEGRADIEVRFHVRLMIQAGLINGKVTATKAFPSSIAPEGYDFLDAVRDEGVWKETKSRTEKVGGWTLDIVKSIAVEIIKQAAGLG